MHWLIINIKTKQQIVFESMWWDCCYEVSQKCWIIIAYSKLCPEVSGNQLTFECNSTAHTFALNICAHLIFALMISITHHTLCVVSFIYFPFFRHFIEYSLRAVPLLFSSVHYISLVVVAVVGVICLFINVYLSHAAKVKSLRIHV